VTHEIIVVENGSTDRTAELVAAISERDETVRLVRLGDADYGEALRAGFLAARGSIVVNFDVDYYDTGFLRRAESLVKSGAADVVIASKRAPGSSDRRPAHRRLLTSVFASLMRLLVGLPVSDAHGMKVASRSALLPVIRQTQMGGSVFDVEVLLAAHRRGLKLVELPAQVREVRPPRTGVSRRAFESFTGLVKLRFIAGPPDEV
jgi:glycosyltransferase involved in cell wall biosynthesis